MSCRRNVGRYFFATGGSYNYIGYSNEEIADELGISIKTVKNQMTKAFTRLREALGDGHKPFFLPFL